MSKPNGRGRGPKGGSYTVGYGRPPAERQFKKGASGNPSGRPKNPKPKGQAMALAVADLVLAEAYRPITIRENDKTITLPTIQAVLRSLSVAAVKGSHRAQLAVTGLVQAAEQGVLDDKLAIFEAAIEHKQYWEDVFRRCDAVGEPRPEPVPHPDDIAINGRTGEVIFNGPFDEMQKAGWDKFTQRKADALEEIARDKRSMKRSPKHKAFLEFEIAHEQWLVDLVDRMLPDEETRRAPGFNIHEWRERQQRIHEIMGKVERPKPSWRPAGAKSAKAPPEPKPILPVGA